MDLEKIMSNALITFWNPSFWLPDNTTWDDFKDTPDITYPKFHEVYYPILGSGIILLLRYVVERFIFIPIGLSKGLKANKKPLIATPLLEEVFNRNPKGLLHSKKEIQGISKQLDWSERQVERWIRRRKQHTKHSDLDKFAECGWKACFYLFATIYGLAYLWNKPWLKNINECWTNYPHQNITLDAKLLYMFQLSYYWSLMFSQFSDVRRKDFWGMFVHHLATILIYIIYNVCNGLRIGTLAQVLHDSADIFLEAAKCFRFIKWRWESYITFVIFVLVWIVTRLVIFPMHIIRHVLFEMGNHFRVPPALHLCSVAYVILFLLHIMWTYYIFKTMHRTLVLGKKPGDGRSSSSEASGETDKRYKKAKESIWAKSLQVQQSSKRGLKKRLLPTDLSTDDGTLKALNVGKK